MDERERKYLDMVSEFPESNLGHFSLARYYVEIGRFQEAIEPLERCLKDDPNWTAASVALGDALVGVGETSRAIQVYQSARNSAHARRHGSITRDIDERLSKFK